MIYIYIYDYGKTLRFARTRNVCPGMMMVMMMMMTTIMLRINNVYNPSKNIQWMEEFNGGGRIKP